MAVSVFDAKPILLYIEEIRPKLSLLLATISLLMRGNVLVKVQNNITYIYTTHFVLTKNNNEDQK